jgi:hypothetical protein
MSGEKHAQNPQPRPRANSAKHLGIAIHVFA